MSRQQQRPRKPSIWFDIARRAALSLPGVVERQTVHGPSFRVGRSLLARLDEDGVSLLVFVGSDEREMLIQAEPKTFSEVARGGDGPSMRIHLVYVDEGTLRRLLTQSWRERAPRRLLSGFPEV
jgi:hypothetical protein